MGKKIIRRVAKPADVQRVQDLRRSSASGPQTRQVPSKRQTLAFEMKFVEPDVNRRRDEFN